MLIDKSTPQQLSATIRRLKEWDARALDCANRMLTVWTQAAIARPNDQQGIAELQRLIHHALHPLAATPVPPESYQARWQGFSDLLEARRLELAHADPAALLRRRNVKEILDAIAVAGGTLEQARIAEQLDVSAGRVTQLVSLMESHGLLTRQRHGRDNRLSTTAMGRELTPKTAARAALGAGMCLTRDGGASLRAGPRKAA